MKKTDDPSVLTSATFLKVSRSKPSRFYSLERRDFFETFEKI